MIDLYDCPTPNGLKLRLFLEETGLPHRRIPVSLSAGDQHRPAFLAISPNGKIPAIVDHAPRVAEGPLPVFESGAILLYLAEKTGQLLPIAPCERTEVMQWLFWQMSGLGPMAGQVGHFLRYAPEPVPYAVDRYTRELQRLYGVLDRRLRERDVVAGADFSIADIAIHPWIVPHAAHGQTLSDFPDLLRWFKAIGERPAVRRAYAGVEDVYAHPGAPVAGAPA